MEASLGTCMLERLLDPKRDFVGQTCIRSTGSPSKLSMAADNGPSEYSSDR